LDQTTPVARFKLLLPNFVLGLKEDSNRHHNAVVTERIQKLEEMIGVYKNMEKLPSSLQSHRRGIWKYRHASYRGKTSLQKLA